MHKTLRIALIVAAIPGVMLSAHTIAADPVTPNLTAKLHRLLQQEMRAVQAAMAAIHSAIITGEHETVASSAQQIHDSFILQQSLTDQDRQDLMSAVPGEFIELDTMFHERAASLANAGREENTEKQRQLFSEMTRDCIVCHGNYVSDRFPGIKVGQ